MEETYVYFVSDRRVSNNSSIENLTTAGWTMEAEQPPLANALTIQKMDILAMYETGYKYGLYMGI